MTTTTSMTTTRLMLWCQRRRGEDIKYDDINDNGEKNVNDEGESNYKIINHDDDKDNNQYDADDDNGKDNDDNNNDDDNGGNDDDNKKMTQTTTKTTKQIMNAPFITYWILRMVNSNQTMKVWSCCGNPVGGTKTWCGFSIQITATEFWRDKKVSCKIGRKWIEWSAQISAKRIKIQTTDGRPLANNGNGACGGFTTIDLCKSVARGAFTPIFNPTPKKF